MLLHYIKIAFRNMWKYKAQTLISLIGLAVGFTCFALATLWIRYEMTFDSFHKNAKQMYVVYRPDLFSPTGYMPFNAYPLAAYLKETFPEIKDAISLAPCNLGGDKVIVDDVEYYMWTITVDSSFFRMFDVKIMEGNRNFLISNSKDVAITQEKARQLFANTQPIGKTVTIRNEEFTICAIVTGMTKQSNYAFDFILPFRSDAIDITLNWFIYNVYTIIELFPDTKVKDFEEKLYDHTDTNRKIKQLTIKPITKIRYLDPYQNKKRVVALQHIEIFAVSGLLVVLCSLFNYLTLFVSRFRIRQKELALRIVWGATQKSLFMMLTVEFMISLLLSVALGGMLTQWFYRPFLILSGIQMNLSAIYQESLLYNGVVIFVTLLFFWLILFIFRLRNLNSSIRRSNKNLSRKISVIAQLMISIGFAFCTVIILKQMYFLRHTDELGFSFRNRGSIALYNSYNSDVLAQQLRQIPEITEAMDTKGLSGLLPWGSSSSTRVMSWDNKLTGTESFDMGVMFISPEYCDFYEFRLLTGEMLTEADPDSLILLNEKAVKAFRWDNAVGKHIDGYIVKGVIKNVCNFAPTLSLDPIIYMKLSGSPRFLGSIRYDNTVVFKYQEGRWTTCKRKIEQLIEKEYDDLNSIVIYNDEEVYNKFLKSENVLLQLLTFVSAICILICLFGFVSLVSLTCEERRKSIAIHKINGATSGDILAIFAKEYALLLCIGAAFALSTGYFIMQRWLEQYVKQTSIPAWIYLSTTCVFALLIVLCVGWQVWRASVENPARVVVSD